MGSISYTVPAAGSTLNSIADPEIATALQTLLTLVNGNVDGANVVPSITGRRLLMQATAFIGSAQGAGTYAVAADGTLVASGANSSKAIVWADLDPTNYSVLNKSNTTALLRMSVATNATAPAVTFTGHMSAVTFAGGPGVIVPTLGGGFMAPTVISPAGSSVFVAEDTVAFPAAAGYAPSVNISGSTAANSGTAVTLQVFVLNT
jgi:hypothetical protein